VGIEILIKEAILNEPILISITGIDRPGITATIAQVLAEFDVNILDIGQSVIHDALSLGMLIQIPEDSADEGTVKNAIQNTIDKLDMSVRFVNIQQENYERWVSSRAKADISLRCWPSASPPIRSAASHASWQIMA
jgi:phosphoserine phosphatase